MPPPPFFFFFFFCQLFYLPLPFMRDADSRKGTTCPFSVPIRKEKEEEKTVGVKFLNVNKSFVFNPFSPKPSAKKKFFRKILWLL